MGEREKDFGDTPNPGSILLHRSCHSREGGNPVVPLVWVDRSEIRHCRHVGHAHQYDGEEATLETVGYARDGHNSETAALGPKRHRALSIRRLCQSKEKSGAFSSASVARLSCTT